MAHVLTSVLIVDDNNTFAEAMRFAIDREPDLSCVGIAHRGSEAVGAVLEHGPDHVLLNLDLADGDGFETVESVRRCSDRLAVTVLTGRTDPESIVRAEVAGANHLIPKQSSIVDVLDALRSPSNGCMTLPGAMLIDLLRNGRQPPVEAGLDGLTARELDVLQQMASGAPPKVIAHTMGISVHTVRGHVKSIYWKLDAHSQLEAIAIASRRGLVTVPG